MNCGPFNHTYVHNAPPPASSEQYSSDSDDTGDGLDDFSTFVSVWIVMLIKLCLKMMANLLTVVMGRHISQLHSIIKRDISRRKAGFFSKKTGQHMYYIDFDSHLRERIMCGANSLKMSQQS